jgi:hypothetical protein
LQVKIWFQNRRTKWKKQENISNAEAAELMKSKGGKLDPKMSSTNVSSKSILVNTDSNSQTSVSSRSAIAENGSANQSSSMSETGLSALLGKLSPGPKLPYSSHESAFARRHSSVEAASEDTLTLQMSPDAPRQEGEEYVEGDLREEHVDEEEDQADRLVIDEEKRGLNNNNNNEDDDENAAEERRRKEEADLKNS